MAGSGQKKESSRQEERVVPRVKQGVSRISQAEGSQSLTRIQGTRVEQRSNVPTTRPKTRNSSSSKQAPRGKRKAGTATKSPSPGSSRATPFTPPAANPRDTQFIQWAHGKWKALEPTHQQRVFATALLCLALLLFASLTVLRAVPVWSAIDQFFLTFFGWSAYLLALGLIAFALVHLIEGTRNAYILRWSTVFGLIVIWLLLLIESRLIMGHLQVGALAEVLVLPFLGWPPAVGHITVLGLLLIVIIITFRITFGQVLMIAQFISHLFAANRSAFSGNTADVATAPSPFLGQRPKYSRYATGNASSIPDRQAAAGQTGRLVRPSRRPIEDTMADDDEDADNIAFEADFDADVADDGDLLNDINIHQQQVSRVPRRGRAPSPLDSEEHASATKGVRQQKLPIDQAVGNVDRLILKSPDAQPVDMEPLAPNPRLAQQPKARAATNPPLPQITSPWKLPNVNLLNSPEEVKVLMQSDDTQSLAKLIQDTLRSFRVDAEVKEEDISIGPTIIRFGIRPTGKPEMMKDEKTGKMLPVRDVNGQIVYEARTRVSRIMALQNDLALVLEAKTIRMEAPVPGRPYVGVEIPNKNSRLVTLREVLVSKEYQTIKSKSKLTIGLGKDVAGQVRIGDLARMPHLLIAGATGAGKSVCINTIIASILTQATPDDVRLLMVDPKMVELNMYNGIPHLLSPVVIEVEKVVSLLKNAINEMERRYRLFSQLGVRNLDSYRKLRLEKLGKGDTSLNNLPAIVIIIDELADLMMAAPEEVEGMICRLAQLARATGIHLVVATQRPSVDVITGLIKANIPTRISFMVSSAVDSRTIIDMGGAERLLGRGDMLYLPADAGRPERIQGAFLTDDEAQALADYWRQQAAEHMAASSNDPTLVASTPAVVEPGWELKAESSDDFELEDDLLDKAEEVVQEYGRASISLLQRRLRVGYSRAARLIDLLEEHGVIGRSEASGRAREVYDHGSDNGYDRHGAEGHSMADEVAEIVAEEKARNEFLRNQAAKFQQQHGHNAPASPASNEDDENER